MVLTGLAKVCFDLTLLISCWRAAVQVHEIFVTNMFRVPCKFFDVTPIGRLLSRFTKDVEIVDSKLPSVLWDFVICSMEVDFFFVKLINISWMKRTKIHRFDSAVNYSIL